MAEARERSAKYDWIGAAECYKQALGQTSSSATPTEHAHLSELLAGALFKAAFQAGSREEFKNVMRQAEASYNSADVLYKKAALDALSMKCLAKASFATFWTSDEYSEKRSHIIESVSQARNAAKVFETQPDKRVLAEAYRDLLSYSFEACSFASDSKVVKEQFEMVGPITERVIKESGDQVDEETLIECLFLTVRMVGWYTDWVESNSELRKRAREAARRAGEISERIGTPYAISLGKWASGWTVIYAEENAADANYRSLELYKAAITAAEPTRDSYVIGSLLSEATERAYWSAGSAEDTEKKRELLEEGIRLGQRAVKNAEVTFQHEYLDWSHSGCAVCYTWLAHYVETEPEKKRKNFRKAMDIATKGMAYQKPGAPWTGCGDVLSKSMYFLAKIETDPEKKLQLLNEALPIREEVIRVQELLTPKGWNLGVYYNYLALIKAELAGLNAHTATQIELLQSAVSTMRHCVELCTQVVAMVPAYASSLAQYDEWYGDILAQLLQRKNDDVVAKQALKAYGDAVDCLTKSELVAPTARVRWKIARIHDSSGDYRQASTAFNDAAKDYRRAINKFPRLSSTHVELELYMEAWSQIENARLEHDEERYPEAAKNYAKASGLLQETRTWAPLSIHYNACSLLERGEALSREEKQEASIEAFSAAASCFQDAAVRLRDKTSEELDLPGRDELREWLDLSKSRQRYSLGRIALEEARTLDKKGEEEESARKYHAAYETFKSLHLEAPNERSRREMETLALFCEAWGKMKQAEVEASPEHYTEAAFSFMKAKESTTRKKFRLLALANASMCKALEAGTLFRRTRDIQLYGEIKKQLETAADHYEQAGFKNATDWTRATQAMFDALAYMASAEVELDAKKKTEFYHLAQKHLELASRLYAEAGYQTKSEEALRHLKRVRQEREILLTPSEVLAENPVAIGAVVAPVSLTRDQAVGLEKYEDAQVVGNLSLGERELGVGSDLTVELEMANLGKATATLIKLENVAPKGFELDRGKIPHRVEDNYIDMKGKRLEYLKTHEVRVPMRALAKGTFEIKPRILFVDEKGSYRSYDFEPAALTVRELGISGWLKGPKTK